MWQYEYDDETDETTIYWNSTEQAIVDGEITELKDGYPVGAAREAVANAIKNAGTPERIRMQYDLNYGIIESNESDSS